MAAYAALASLMYILEQIQHHPRPPISLHQNQVQSLTENITFLQDFLEVYNYHVHNDGLESRIRDAAHAAEDVIESRIVDQILGQSNSTGDLFYRDLQKVIQDMDFIKKDVMEIKENTGSVQHHFHKRSSTPDAASSRLSPTITVGSDDVRIQLLDKLTRQPSSGRQIIPIVGMGGIGKTTLAKSVYDHSLIVRHFDICAWATVSLEYSAREILLQLLFGQGGQGSSSLMSERELGDMLYKRLWGRRYLIVMDDIWSVEAWEKIKLFFPNNNNGSGIMITSRLSNKAWHLIAGCVIEMNFLDEDVSWSLMCKIVFGEGDCPLELEAIGKKIAKNCKGLPLSLSVIGGLLAKSNRTREYWEYIVENLNSIVNSEDDSHCLKLLYLSYNQLPVHLKPCFLYFGVYPEDKFIFASDLIELWVGEGFLKPNSSKSLEEVAEGYLTELIDRNLILVSWREYNGKVTGCRIHDLLRDLCLREAEKQKFLCVTRQHSHDIFPQGLNMQRRIALHHDASKEELLTALQSASNARSLIFHFGGVLPSLNFRLLRVLRNEWAHSPEAIFFQFFNLRFIRCMTPKVPSSLYLLWNLQTLIVPDSTEVALDIWKMPQLRHVAIRGLCLSKTSDSLMHGQGDFILENLQSLWQVQNFRCSEKMVKRIPNIKELHISYTPKRFVGSYYGLNNLVLLQKLKKLSCEFHTSIEPIDRGDLLHSVTFPHSLKDLTLSGCRLHWEDVSTKIGSLPHLQMLSLQMDPFVGPEWETIEGQFCNLIFLKIESCQDLECWITDSTHFPCLKVLNLLDLPKLKEIPLNIGDIPTLQLIDIDDCSDSVFVSAKKIVEEQEEVGNEGLQVQATIWEKNEAVESLASNNYSVVVVED